MPESTKSSSSSAGSSFFAGLTVGVLAGVAGYYLFGTKQGQQTREKISAEWAKAQEFMNDSVSQAEPDTEKWQQFFNQMARELGFQRQRHKSKPKVNAKTSVFVKKARQVKKSATKFIGV